MEDKRAITMDDGERYLEVCHRIADARRDGCMVRTQMVLCTDRLAIIKAEIANKLGKVVSEAYGSRQANYEPYYIEHAETAAIGRALSEAGYNIYSYELGEDFTENKIMLPDGTDYLNVPFRIAQFRKEHPGAIIKKYLLDLDNKVMGPENGGATFRIEIYESDALIAVAHARRVFNEEEKRRNYVECAETAAIGRALSILGYDLPPGEGNHFSDVKDMAEAPACCHQENKGTSGENASNRPATNSAVPSTTPVQKENGNGKGARTSSATPKAATSATPATSPAPTTLAASGLGSYVIPSGVHKGKTLGAVWKGQWEYVRKVAYDPRVGEVAEKEFVNAARELCVRYGIMKITDTPRNPTGKAQSTSNSAEKTGTPNNQASNPPVSPKPTADVKTKKAGQVVIETGQYKGLSIKEAFEKNPEYVRWIYEKSHFKSHVINAAKVYVEANTKK